MKDTFTVEEIKKYILSKDSLGDVLYYLNAKNIEEANKKDSIEDLIEDDEDRILVENGDMFDGTRDQFKDNYFTNANNAEIKDWCFENGWSLSINGKTIL